MPQLWFENKKGEVEEMHLMSSCLLLLQWLFQKDWKKKPVDSSRMNTVIVFSDKHGPEFQSKDLGEKYPILEKCLHNMGSDERASNSLNLRLLRMHDLVLSANLCSDDRQYQHFLNDFKNWRKC